MFIRPNVAFSGYLAHFECDIPGREKEIFKKFQKFLDPWHNI
jgi:hypothetical protein